MRFILRVKQFMLRHRCPRSLKVWQSIQSCSVLEGLALVAGESVEQCLEQRAVWTLERLFERRLPLQTIMVVRGANGSGIPYGKSLIGGASLERVRALGAAVDRADTEAAEVVLDAWVPNGGVFNQLLVKALVEAFAGPSG